VSDHGSFPVLCKFCCGLREIPQEIKERFPAVLSARSVAKAIIPFGRRARPSRAAGKRSTAMIRGIIERGGARIKEFPGSLEFFASFLVKQRKKAKS
jgi:hypothetical protein